MIRKCLLLALSLLTSPLLFAEDAWVLQKDTDGIVIYTRPVHGTPYSQFKAITKIKTSLFSILALWADPSTYCEWMFNCRSATLLKQETPLALYAYIVSAVPWPLVSRDNVLYADTTQDEITGKINIELTGIPDYIAPTKNMIRVVQSYGRVGLNPMENGEVEVVFEFFMNPGGLIPAPIINLTLIDFPFFTMKKMREVVKKSKFQEVNYEFLKNPM